MAESKISDIELVKSEDEYASDENIEINVKFSVEGALEMHSMKQTGQRHTTKMMSHSN